MNEHKNLKTDRRAFFGYIAGVIGGIASVVSAIAGLLTDIRLLLIAAGGLVIVAKVYGLI